MQTVADIRGGGGRGQSKGKICGRPLSTAPYCANIQPILKKPKNLQNPSKVTDFWQNFILLSSLAEY